MNCDCSRCQTEGCNANYLCPCCLKAEVERLTAAIQRVRELRQKWRHDVIATMGKALPGGVLSVPLNAVESQLGRALDGDGK